MKCKWLNDKDLYDGTQLVSLRNYLKHGLLGDSVVAWVGPCNIPFEHMVDGEDLLEESAIRGDRMLHFIIELFDSRLFEAVTVQRLFATMIKDEVEVMSPLKPRLKRDGDDLFLNDGKLSISIATQSPVSSLIHFAVNVTNQGTPVKTSCLDELEIAPKDLADRVMEKLAGELKTIREATCKVRWVR